MNMLEKQVLEERDPYLNEEEDIIMIDSREDHWRNISRDRGKIHALRWDVYTKNVPPLLDAEQTPETLSLSTPPYLLCRHPISVHESYPYP